MNFDDNCTDPDLVEKAQAMLATCRHKMTGMEIDMCERLAGMAQRDYEPFSIRHENLQWFYNMTIQFAREIGEWIDSGKVVAA